MDTCLDAGNPESDPGTGVGCSAGRRDQDLTDMESDAVSQDERIDHIFLSASAASTCSLDSMADFDGDGAVASGFANAPNPFAESCGPSPLSICWASDHGGVQMDLNCGSK